MEDDYSGDISSGDFLVFGAIIIGVGITSIIMKAIRVKKGTVKILVHSVKINYKMAFRPRRRESTFGGSC
jgi:hypothetical protein